MINIRKIIIELFILLTLIPSNKDKKMPEINREGNVNHLIAFCQSEDDYTAELIIDREKRAYRIYVSREKTFFLDSNRGGIVDKVMSAENLEDVLCMERPDE